VIFVGDAPTKRYCAWTWDHQARSLGSCCELHVLFCRYLYPVMLLSLDETWILASPCAIVK
jgi:hypothetical protein